MGNSEQITYKLGLVCKLGTVIPPIPASQGHRASKETQHGGKPFAPRNVVLCQMSATLES